MSRIGRVLLALMVASSSFELSAGDPNPDLEYRVKAAYIYNLFKFVQWPSHAEAPGELVQVCIAGQDPFGRILEDSFAQKSVGGRPVRVVRLSRTDDMAGCHVVFFGAMSRKNLLETLRRLDGLPVLSVGENDDFLRFGGILAFHIEDNKVRFQIVGDRAQRAGLHVSSQLLMLSRGVR